MKYEINSMVEHIDLIQRMAAKGFTKPYSVTVDFSDGRTLDQNSLLWAALTDISQQVEWHGQKLVPEDWKQILTAAMMEEKQRAVPGINGGIVFLGTSTSRMSKKQLSDLMEVIYHFGATNNVKFKEAQQ